MDAVEIYLAHTENTRKKLETEMKYAAEKIVELERIVDAGRKADKELKKVRKEMMKLAISYTELEEGK